MGPAPQVDNYVEANRLLQARVSARMRRIGDKIDRGSRFVFPLTYFSSLIILFNITLDDKYSSENGRGSDVFDVQMQAWIPKAYVQAPQALTIALVAIGTATIFLALWAANVGNAHITTKNRLQGEAQRKFMAPTFAAQLSVGSMRKNTSR